MNCFLNLFISCVTIYNFFVSRFFRAQPFNFYWMAYCALSWNPFFCYLSSHLIVNDFCYFCASIRGNFYRGLCPLNTPPLTPKNYFSNFCFLEFDSQSYNKHSQNFVIRNMQTLVCLLLFEYLWDWVYIWGPNRERKLSYVKLN